MVDTLFIVLWSIIFAGVVTILVIWLFLRSFPYKVRIREITSTKVRLIHDTLAKVKKTSDKIEYLGLLNKRGGHDALPLPQPDAIDYDPTKKKKIVEAYYSDETGYVYIKDGQKIDTTDSTKFEPLPTKSRQMLVNQIKKKEARKTHSWTQNIPLIVGAITLVSVLAILLIFWGEAVKPMVDFGGQMSSLVDKLDLVADKLVAAERGTQIIAPS